MYSFMYFFNTHIFEEKLLICKFLFYYNLWSNWSACSYHIRQSSAEISRTVFIENNENLQCNLVSSWKVSLMLCCDCSRKGTGWCCQRVAKRGSLCIRVWTMSSSGKYHIPYTAVKYRSLKAPSNLKRACNPLLHSK